MMDFFAQQEKTKSRTAFFSVAFLISATLIAMLLSLLIIIFSPHGFVYDNVREVTSIFADPAGFFGKLDLLKCFMLLGGIVFFMSLVSLYQIHELSQGGGESIAESLGGTLISSHTKSTKEKQLLNITEEMAIAAGMPVPPVYLLKNENEINAFAAGNDLDDAVIGVTQGAVDRLSRDELQGIIAHEYSHIFNGDMRMNIRFIGILAGIIIFFHVGTVLARMRSRSRSDGKLVVIGLGLIVIGYFGHLIGRIIKAYINRQRELLADATALQYTRHDGIIKALKKIQRAGSAIEDSRADRVSHMFFASGGFGFLFASHPPLFKRISVLTGQNIQPMKEQVVQESGAGATAFAGKAAAISGFTASSNKTIQKRASYSKKVSVAIPLAENNIQAINKSLKEMVHDPLEANALIYLIFISTSLRTRSKQMQNLELYSQAPVYRTVAGLLKSETKVKDKDRLSLLQLAMPALKTLSPKQKEELLDNVQMLINADNEVEVFEFALAEILWRNLRKRQWSDQAKLPEMKKDNASAYILSILAKMGHTSLSQAKNAFKKGMDSMSNAGSDSSDLFIWNQAIFAAALKSLQRLSEIKKQQFLAACLEVAEFDKKVTANELEIIQAISLSLGVAIPTSFLSMHKS